MFEGPPGRGLVFHFFGKLCKVNPTRGVAQRREGREGWVVREGSVVVTCDGPRDGGDCHNGKPVTHELEGLSLGGAAPR